MTSPANSSSVCVLALSWVKKTKDVNPVSVSSAIRSATRAGVPVNPPASRPNPGRP
jgi:hypothetical protein